MSFLFGGRTLLLCAAILTFSSDSMEATNLSVCDSPEIGKPCLLRCEPKGENLTSFFKDLRTGSGEAYCSPPGCCEVKEKTRYIAYRNDSGSTDLIITIVQKKDEGLWVCVNDGVESNMTNLTLKNSSQLTTESDTCNSKPTPKPEGGCCAFCIATIALASLLLIIIGGLIYYKRRNRRENPRRNRRENQREDEEGENTQDMRPLDSERRINEKE